MRCQGEADNLTLMVRGAMASGKRKYSNHQKLMNGRVLDVGDGNTTARPRSGEQQPNVHNVITGIRGGQFNYLKQGYF